VVREDAEDWQISRASLHDYIRLTAIFHMRNQRADDSYYSLRGHADTLVASNSLVLLTMCAGRK
jgi:hypothetical protein